MEYCGRLSDWDRDRGEEQLAGYLDHYGLKKGYMLSFNFNKKKEIGVKVMIRYWWKRWFREEFAYDIMPAGVKKL
jgi:hypothetical protein